MNFRAVFSFIGIFIGGFLILAGLSGETIKVSSNVSAQKQINQITITNNNLSGIKPVALKNLNNNNLKVIEGRFVVKGDMPQEKIKRLTDKMKSGNIASDDPDIILLKPATDVDKPITLQAYPTGSNNQKLLQVVGPSIPADYKNICPYNKIQGTQCGGLDAYDKIRHENCRDIRPLAFYTQCNYGQWPAYINDPRDYTAQCSGIDGGNCACGCEVKKLSDRCPAVLTCIRLVGIDCIVMPHSCEQCCGGGTWLWDDVTGGCSCQTPS